MYAQQIFRRRGNLEIASEYQEFGDKRHIESLENAFQKAEELVAKLTGSFQKKP